MPCATYFLKRTFEVPPNMLLQRAITFFASLGRMFAAEHHDVSHKHQ